MILLIMDAVFAFLLVCCAVGDHLHRTISNRLIALMMGLGILHMVVACAGDGSVTPYLMAIPLFFLCCMCWRRGLFGGGDVKLMTAICLYFGFWRTAIAFEVSLLAMLTRYGVYLCGHKRRKNMRIALAPPLAVGCLITLAGPYIMAVF